MIWCCRRVWRVRGEGRGRVGGLGWFDGMWLRLVSENCSRVGIVFRPLSSLPLRLLLLRLRLYMFSVYGSSGYSQFRFGFDFLYILHFHSIPKFRLPPPFPTPILSLSIPPIPVLRFRSSSLALVTHIFTSLYSHATPFLLSLVLLFTFGSR